MIAFPIYEGISISGVIEIFKKSSIPIIIDKETENLLNMMGVAIGQFIQKLDAKKAQEQLISIVTYSANALFLVDTHG